MVKRAIGAVALASVFSLGSAFATPFVSPDPATFGPDADGDGYFSQPLQATVIEYLDAPTQFAGLPAEYGFYFKSDPLGLIPIFETSDQNPPPQQTVVDFGAGWVYDADEASLQDTFAPTVGDIGFYLSLDPALASLLGYGDSTVYSDPLLNGGSDYFAAFSFLPSPGAIAPSFYDAQGQLAIYQAVAVATGVPGRVPAPSVIMLLLLGLGLMGVASRRRG